MHRKKLIEVALPLDAINAASAREKSIRHGHPSTLHLWWARRPLAAARAVIFAQMVDDPSEWPELFPTEAEQDAERERLFKLIEELVKWENTTNEDVLEDARRKIWDNWRRTCETHADDPSATELFDPAHPPAFHDPFAGGGALPLEAQRLGLEAHAGDLNPVAVLINKAMIEIPPKFAGRPPVNPDWRSKPDEEKALSTWNGAQGLAEDVRYYGKWMRDQAQKRIGHLYPKACISTETCRGRPDLRKYEGRELTVIAWLWARTVRSPNPAFADVEVPLVSSFWLSRKKGKEAWVRPVVEGREWRFEVRKGCPEDPIAVGKGTKLSRGANFRCLVSGTPIGPDWLKAEGMAGRMGAQLMAVVADGDRERVYLNPTLKHETAATVTKPDWGPEGDVPRRLTGGTCFGYGLTEWRDLFTSRQLIALTMFSELVAEAQIGVRRDAAAAGMRQAGRPLRQGGKGRLAYSEAIAVYLAFAVDRLAMSGNTLARWNAFGQKIQHCFGRQALPMIYDFGESNFLGYATGSVSSAIFYCSDPLSQLGKSVTGTALRGDATTTMARSTHGLISTDPPYYDNVGYADLSDFFYVWLRHTLKDCFPDLFLSMTVPKDGELVAVPWRHGDKAEAERFFMSGMIEALQQMAERPHPAFPVTVYYAFKQSVKSKGDRVVSTGWETFLQAVVDVGFAVTGTWPIRTEMRSRQVSQGTSALASSIVLVCRKRSLTAGTITRRQFRDSLADELAEALRKLQTANIAPVDLAQAAIGPGMAIFTRHAAVVHPDGKPVKVREALRLINQALDEALEGDFDGDTRWAVAWFESHGFEAGEFGVAEVLAKAKNISIDGLAEAGVLESMGGQVRLLRPSELSEDWNPGENGQPTTWEKTHHLLKVYAESGEIGAAKLLDRLGPADDAARDLAYSAYLICERKKWANAAFGYNALVQSWAEIARQTRLKPWLAESAQFELGEDSDAD